MFPISVSVPVRFPPIMTYVLIAANAVVFLLQASLPDSAQEALAYGYGLVPARYAHPEWARRVGLDPGNYLPFLTNMFMHGGWLHIILNMWTLWLFGPAIEDRLGAARYAAFYLACGLAAGLAHAWMNADSRIPVVGASGAIAGVLGAHLRLFPFSNVLILIPILFLPFFFTLPTIVYTALWFIMQVVQGLGSTIVPQAGGIAWWAHIGGFLAGVLVAPLLCCSPRAYRAFYGDEGVMGFRSRGERT